MIEKKIKVKINVAGRFYPLTIEPKEEQAVRKAGKKLNEMIKQFEQNYQIQDKQDVLSMCALMMSSKMEIANVQNQESKQKERNRLNHLIDLINK